MDYVTYLYHIIKNYFYPDLSKYILPFNPNDILNTPEFKNFKSDTKELNKIVFALNNLPDTLHQIITKNTFICSQYYYITIYQTNNKTEIMHNIDNIQNETDNYVYIRINVINNSNNKMHHVNCVIHDKINKTVLLFDPQIDFDYDPQIILDLLDNYMDLKINKVLLPQDIGYNSYNHLQKYDAFCQTYILFILLLIVNNPTIPYIEYSKMFNGLTTHTNIGYFLYTIHELLKDNKFDICDQGEVWSYPTNSFLNIFNLMNYFLDRDHKIKEEDSNIKIKEVDGMLIIDAV